jgi:hypothetical protein
VLCRRDNLVHRPLDLVRGEVALVGKQRQRLGTARIPVKSLDRLAPRCGLREVDFAKIQDAPLGRPAIVETLVLDDVPIGVRLAVLLSFDSP